MNHLDLLAHTLDLTYKALGEPPTLKKCSNCEQYFHDLAFAETCESCLREDVGLMEEAREEAGVALAELIRKDE